MDQVAGESEVMAADGGIKARSPVATSIGGGMMNFFPKSARTGPDRGLIGA